MLPLPPQPRRRIRGKTPPLHAAAEAAAASALQAEVASARPELLPPGVKRKHVHYTFVRTHGGQYQQPAAFSRDGFFQLLLAAYREAYPRPHLETGTTMLFAAVAEEKHADGAPHLHAAVFCTEQHYWNRVAKVSREHFRVPLDAVDHKTYSEMYTYLRAPSNKKPLQDLDAEIYLSPLHPRGAALTELLDAGARALRMQHGRVAGAAATALGAGAAGKRPRAPSMYELVAEKRFRTALDVQCFANAEAAAGRPALADFCTRNGHKLQEALDNAPASAATCARACGGCDPAYRSRVWRASARQHPSRGAAGLCACTCGGLGRHGGSAARARRARALGCKAAACCRKLSL